MTTVALTGTPGTGKSSVASILREKAIVVFEIAELIEALGISMRFNARYGSNDVDVDELRKKVNGFIEREGQGTFFISGHLSHFAGCDIAVVLRCEPHVLMERLERRGWSRKKIIENVRAEVLDVITVEAAERIKDVFEVDTTASDTVAAAQRVVEAVERKPDSLRPGRINWSGEIEEWF